MNIWEILKVVSVGVAGFVLFILAFGACAGTTAADYASWAMDILEAWRRRFNRFGGWIVALFTWVMPAQNRTDIVGRRIERLVYDLKAQIRAAEKVGLSTKELQDLLIQADSALAAWKKEDMADWRRMRSLNPNERWRDLGDLTEKEEERRADEQLNATVLQQRAELELEAAAKELAARAKALYYDKGYMRRKYNT